MAQPETVEADYRLMLYWLHHNSHLLQLPLASASDSLQPERQALFPPSTGSSQQHHTTQKPLFTSSCRLFHLPERTEHSPPLQSELYPCSRILMFMLTSRVIALPLTGRIYTKSNTSQSFSVFPLPSDPPQHRCHFSHSTLKRPTERMMPKSLWHTPTSCCSSQPQHPIRPVSQPRQPVIRYCSQLLLFWLLKVATLTRAYKIKHVTFMLYIPRRGRRRGHGSWCSPCCDFHLARTLSPGRSVFSLVLRYYAHSFIHSWRAIES